MPGHAREGSRRDALASTLAAAEGQRVVYVGRRKGEGEVRAREAIFAGCLFPEMGSPAQSYSLTA